MGVTLKDIARLALVSEGTASLALNNKPGVNIDTRNKVLAIAQETGYVASQHAKSLAKKRSSLIGVLMPNIRNLFRSSLAQDLENETRALGYKMILSTTDNNKAYERAMIEQFISFRVEGVIIYPNLRNCGTPEYLELLRKNNIPFVFVGSYYRDDDAPHAISDIYGGICAAVEHLLASGCTNLYYLGANPALMSSHLKILALRDTLARAGVAFPDEHYIHLEHTNYEQGYRAADELILSGVRMDAVLTGDTTSGFGVYNALRGHGLRVPEDVSIIHFDNLIQPEICVIQMTCIEQDVHGITIAVLDILKRQIAGEQHVENCLIPTRLIVRDSTREPIDTAARSVR